MHTVGPHMSRVSPWPGPPLSGLLKPCDRPIILTGAGISAGCGLPTGGALATWLRGQDFAADVDFSGIDAQGRGTHPGYIASRILDHDRSRRETVSQAVADHIADRQVAATLSTVVMGIAATPVGVVLTLNYDTLVEEAARTQGREAYTLRLDDIPELINDHLYARDGALRVVHLHGVLDDPRSLVLDHHTYMRQANEGPVRDLFIALMAHNNLCAIGTQFEEDYLAAIMLARRPSWPRHVIVCDVDLAQRVLDDNAGLGADRHHWLPCSYPVGDYEALDAFCERLVTCDDVGSAGGAKIEPRDVEVDTVYAARRLIARDEVETDTELPAEMQLQFGDLRAHDETILEQEQLSIVVGPPGSGKTRLLQELARRPRGGERAVLLRLRELRQVVGEPELLLRAWLEHAHVLDGDPLQVDDVLNDRARVWVLLDGLDEAPLEHRVTLAGAVERLARSYPQHRFTVTSRPVAALGNLSAPWRAFDLLCDDTWQTEFLGANDADAQELWDALEPGGPQLRSLLRIPFFLRGSVQLVRQGTPVTDAMQISLALLDQALGVDDQLALLGGAPRRLLARVALLQQLGGETTTTQETLVAFAADEADVGDPLVVADLLAGRSLLTLTPEGDWAFEHRLFGEALVADHLLGEDPAAWIDCAVPETHGWSAVLDHWAAPLQMVASRSGRWRAAIAERDVRFAARATPPDGPLDERAAAAALLWRRATDLDIWIDPIRRDFGTVTDGEIVAGLIRAGSLNDLEAEIRAGLEAPTRFVRGNAVDVLSMIPVPDIVAILARVLEHDPDYVVRRSAASAARRLELAELTAIILERAKTPEDESEAGDMASVALRLSAPDRRLAVAVAIVEAGNHEVRDYMVLEGAPLADRAQWLAMRAKLGRGMASSVARELADVVAEAGGRADEALAERLGYAAALVESRDERVLEFVASTPAAARGLVTALEEGAVVKWEIGQLLEAAGEVGLREAGAPDEVMTTVASWGTAREAPVPEPEIFETPEPGSRPDLSDVLRLPVEERRVELIRRASLDRAKIDELTEPEIEVLRETLDEWWGDADLRAAVRVTGRSANIEHWAVVILSFGLAMNFALSEERWVQVATCGFLFEPQYKWLIGQASQDRIDRASDEAAGNLRVLSELLYVGVELDTAPVVERLVQADDSTADELDRSRAGESLLRAQNRAGLEALAGASERWYAALRRPLAAVGVVEAQLAELADLAASLRAGERPGPFDLEWLSGVTDLAALEALEAVLVLAGQHRAPEAYPDITVPVLNAIARLGIPTAVDFLDRVARERPYPGAQFLVDERDRLMQFLLEPAGREAARVRAVGLGLAVDTEA
jgi:hypothetical protein